MGQIARVDNVNQTKFFIDEEICVGYQSTCVKCGDKRDRTFEYHIGSHHDVKGVQKDNDGRFFITSEQVDNLIETFDEPSCHECTTQM